MSFVSLNGGTEISLLGQRQAVQPISRFALPAAWRNAWTARRVSPRPTLEVDLSFRSLWIWSALLAVALALIVPTLIWLWPERSADKPETVLLPRRTFRHQAEVWAVTFSPDSKLIATASVDKTVKVWALANASLARTLQHPEGVTAVAFSPDGHLIATTSYDRKVRLWNVEDGKLLCTLAGHTKTPWTVAFSPNGRTVASSGEDSIIILWNVATGARVRTFTGHERTVWSVAFDPNGTRLMSGSFDHTIRSWPLDGTAVSTTVGRHDQAIVDVAFSSDGRLLASGGDDAKVRVWRTDGTLDRVLDCSPKHVDAVAFALNNRYLLSGGHDRGMLGEIVQNFAGNRLFPKRGSTIRLWRMSDGALVQILAEHENDVRGLAVSPDGKWAASASEDRTAILYQILPPAK